MIKKLFIIDYFMVLDIKFFNKIFSLLISQIIIIYVNSIVNLINK